MFESCPFLKSQAARRFYPQLGEPAACQEQHAVGVLSEEKRLIPDPCPYEADNQLESQTQYKESKRE